jgi:nucleoside-diphosphate-sugar epimerase
MFARFPQSPHASHEVHPEVSTDRKNIMKNTVLVLGARGRLGGALAQAFAAAGWRVLAQRRAGGKASAVTPGIEWLDAEAADTPTLKRVAAGARVVVHAMNPAYTTAAWRVQGPALMQAAINAAAALGAVLLFPGNVYNFGAGMPAVLAPDTPQRPSTEKGRIRVDLEQQLAQATRERGLRAVVIRAGDFFGAGSGSWLDQVIVKKLPQGGVTWPGKLDGAHAWAYLPDLAQAFVRVAETNPAQTGGRFESLHFAGHTVSGQDWLAALTEIAWEQSWLPAGGALRTGRLPWGMMRLVSPFSPTVASLLEMRYLWDVPHALDGTALARCIGTEPHTLFQGAVRAAIADLALAPRGANALGAHAGRPVQASRAFR